jgi:hypothetical protein
LIEIPRSVLRQFRLALKRSFPPRCRPEQKLWVVVKVGKDKLTIHAQHTDAGISLQLPAHHAPEVLALPAAALDEAQGREGSVTLERQGDKIVARWDEAGIPRVLEFDTTDPANLPSFPQPPTSFVVNPPELLKALDQAMHCAAMDGVRYATCKVQLRGSGEIVATDGKQLLMQGGFKFPWKDSVLVPRMTLFGAGVLPEDAPVKIGRSGKHVVIQAGDWTVALTADTEGRFPKVEEVIPKGNSTTWTLSPADTAAILQALPKLPGLKDENAPVTVELNGKVVVGAKGEGQGRPVELHLEQSRITGPPIRFSTNRNLLARALQLGFREVRVVNADTPLVCQEAQRLFVWMPLPKESCTPGHPDTIVVRGLNSTSPPNNKTERRRSPPRQRARGSPITQPPAEQAAKPNGLGSLIEEARELTTAMRGMFARSRSLLSALRLHRRKARIVDSTLASLKKLHGKVQ